MPTDAQLMNIPIAGFQSIYSMKGTQAALDNLESEANQGLRALYEKMLRLGSERLIVQSSSTAPLESLDETCPNFSAVTQDIKKSLALAAASREALSFTPMLLLGEPGTGKTYFAQRLARLLGTGYEFVSMSSLTAGWILSGASSQWKESKAGKVTTALINGTYANPVVLVDEIDKASGGQHYDPLGALYQLLEKETAREFCDEFIEIPVDASHVLWIATANEEERIPKPILSRVVVYEIEQLTEEQSRAIAKNVYASLLKERPSLDFDAELTQGVLTKLGAIPARDMKKLLQDALGTAIMAKRRNLRPEDIDSSKRSNEKRRIGF